jgi:hypothetical protein
MGGECREESEELGKGGARDEYEAKRTVWVRKERKLGKEQERRRVSAKGKGGD